MFVLVSRGRHYLKLEFKHSKKLMLMKELLLVRVVINTPKTLLYVVIKESLVLFLSVLVLSFLTQNKGSYLVLKLLNLVRLVQLNTVLISRTSDGIINFTDTDGTEASVGIGTTVNVHTSGIITKLLMYMVGLPPLMVM